VFRHVANVAHVYYITRRYLKYAMSLNERCEAAERDRRASILYNNAGNVLFNMVGLALFIWMHRNTSW
jgi:hypothetical protein